jgi:hypothetical protein
MIKSQFFSPTYKSSSPNKKKNEEKWGKKKHMSNQIIHIVGCHNYGGFHHLKLCIFI